MKIQLGNNMLVTGPLPRSRGVEIKTTKTGRTYAKFSVRAGSQRQEDGTYEDDWINCVAWGSAVDLCMNVRPGDSVLVAGTIKKNTFTGRDGEERTTQDLSIDFLLPSSVPPVVEGRIVVGTGGFKDMPDDSEGDLPF